MVGRIVTTAVTVAAVGASGGYAVDSKSVPRAIHGMPEALMTGDVGKGKGAGGGGVIRL